MHHHQSTHVYQSTLHPHLTHLPNKQRYHISPHPNDSLPRQNNRPLHHHASQRNYIRQQTTPNDNLQPRHNPSPPTAPSNSSTPAKHHLNPHRNSNIPNPLHPQPFPPPHILPPPPKPTPLQPFHLHIPNTTPPNMATRSPRKPDPCPFGYEWPVCCEVSSGWVCAE